MTDDENDDEIDDEIERAALGPWDASGRAAFARIESLTLNGLATPVDGLLRALVPGTQIGRHGRTWFMGQVRQEGSSIVGRIGFQTRTVAEVWDSAAVDFHDAMVQAGTTSPFAIDPDAMRVVFQLRPGVIRVRSFTGALQALMNEASPVDRWRVDQEVTHIPFAAWARGVDRVVRLRVKLRPPNPHYGPRARVKELVEGANSRMTQVAWNADPEALDGIDVDDAFVREAIEHAEKYGEFAAVGESNGTPSVWGSDEEAASEERLVDADPLTREIRSAALREQLGDFPPPDVQPS